MESDRPPIIPSSNARRLPKVQFFQLAEKDINGNDYSENRKFFTACHHKWGPRRNEFCPLEVEFQSSGKGSQRQKAGNQGFIICQRYDGGIVYESTLKMSQNLTHASIRKMLV
ncbi:hypothetical protein CEXT_247431 [Caerostris extrusa]|uniref:Uncharacterized protein n=1 Tax=Caerostris extrusa TaxID=172846 RepID=A0AAV4PB55_CAEEX|nr:hypothetical protein CEXT_247431 [Caerostris extrusa]